MSLSYTACGGIAGTDVACLGCVCVFGKMYSAQNLKSRFLIITFNVLHPTLFDIRFCKVECIYLHTSATVWKRC